MPLFSHLLRLTAIMLGAVIIAAAFALAFLYWRYRRWLKQYPCDTDGFLQGTVPFFYRARIQHRIPEYQVGHQFHVMDVQEHIGELCETIWSCLADHISSGDQPPTQHR